MSIQALMELAETEPTQAIIPGAGARVVAHVFEHPEGLVFADAGWCQLDNTTHPFHIVAGEIEEADGEWRIGGVVFRRIEEQDDLTLDWQNWKHYQAANDPNGQCGRALALEQARLDLEF